jgi:hypothetical protein
MSGFQDGLRRRRCGRSISPIPVESRDAMRGPERSAAQHAIKSKAARLQLGSAADVVILCVLTLLAILTRFYRISEPRA